MKSVEAPKDSPEYQAYLWARERVLKMKEMESSRPGGADSPSDYWREELANLDYMLDATPAIIRKLRHHCFHISGTRVYDYRSNQDAKQRNFKARLQELVGIAGKQLLVPESPILGGFGFQIDGNLYNIDTLKFFEVLIGMDLAGALDAFRGNQERRLVWEIGVGWGGFAYQFKTLFPNVTYLMVDFPELFLFSAVYLKAAFPQSRMSFYGEDADSELFADWQKHDFIFTPSTSLDALRPDRLDLTINMVSFQEMTTEQVRAYVKRASDLKCPALYSMNRDRSPYNKQLTNVRSVLSEYYDIRELDVLDSDYASAVKGSKRGEKSKEGLHYRHVVGRLPVAKERAKGPEVGIGMTLHNNARYLEEALDSLLGQTYEDFGLILVDDGSTDGTEEIVRRYAARDRRIVSYRHNKRRGMVASWRKA
ncbi:MAG: putative sugar O-methyltransferase, partial [Nitrospinota bacterium]